MSGKDDFRGPLPLRDSDFAAIRARVLQKIERRPAVPIAWRFAFAAAAVAALVFLLMPRPQPLPARGSPSATSSAAPSTASAVGQDHGAPPIAAAENSGTAPRPVQQARPHQSPKPTAIASNGAAPTDSEMHIEIQTADPNIRIIWIASR